MVSRRRVAVDIGGTFTDLVLADGGRLIARAKTLTTPGDPSEGVERGLRQLLGESTDPPAIAEVIHATTLVSNALIERRGARTGLVTSAGFRDVLDIGREHRYDMYDLFLDLPRPLVPRRLRWEVDERVFADGTVESAPRAEQVREIAADLQAQGVESVAVCLLNSYRAAGHERLVGETLRAELPGIPVTLSSDLVPEVGELIRASTTTANAYVLPAIRRYLGILRHRLDALGIRAPLHIMLSTGGLAATGTAADHPVRMAESGPAAGALGAAFFGSRSGSRQDVLAFDMGGTTAKACLVEGGVPLLAREHEVARADRFAKGSGLLLRVPVIDLIEIGAGGGSIAQVGPLGTLRVGPGSAGAEPGPACYGHGGEQPTVTDADLVLGYLDPGFFLGGRMALDGQRALAAVGRLGGRLGLSAAETAAGIHRVVNEAMAGAARIHSIERGRDLRRVALVATGGAGPVHAWGVASALGMRRVIYPPSAGVASAVGLLTGPPAFDFVQSLPGPLCRTDWAAVRSALRRLEREGRRRLVAAGAEAGEIRLELACDVRHVGQGETIGVALGAALDRRAPARQVRAAFEQAYRALYGRRPPGVEPEVMTWRLRVRGRQPVLRTSAPAPARGGARKGRREAWCFERRRFVPHTVWDRYRLAAGEAVAGPAIIEEDESTVVLGRGGTATVQASGNLEVRVG